MSTEFEDIINNGSAGPADAAGDISRYEGHFALRGMKKGSAQKLLGKVCIVFFFVHDIKCAWKKEERDIMKKVVTKVVDELNSQSGLSKNRLSLSYAYDEVPVQMKFTSKDYMPLVPEILRLYGDYDTVAKYSEHYKEKFSKDEAPLMFFLHKNFRSFAHRETADSGSGSELSFVSYSHDVDNCVRTAIHELLHQFGAIDYYMPEKVKLIAEKIFEDSIMNGGTQIDPLTRYIIGWDEKPDESVFRFLEETKDVTDEEILEARLKDADNDW